MLIGIKGDAGFSEDVAYSNPSGHRVAAGGTWSDDAYDPFDDILAGMEKLRDKGYTVARMIAGTPVINFLLANENMKQRLGMISIASGTVVGLSLSATLNKLNNFLEEEGMPRIEKYDLQYRTQTTTGYFLKRDVFVMVATTGRDEDLDLGDTDPFTLPNTLGYTGIGRPANRNTSGRAVVIEYNDKKGAPVTGQAWQTSLPIITNPEAIYIITTIA